MTDRQYIFAIPEGKDLQEIKSELQTHVAVRAERRKTVDRTFYDSFDWRIYEKGAALEERVVNGLHTLTWRDNSGEVDGTLNLTKVPRFAWELSPGRLRQHLESVLEMRALMPQVRVRSATLPLNLLNEDDKIVVRATLEKNDVRRESGRKAGDVGQRLVLAPVRGYHEDLMRVVSIIVENLNLTPAEDSLLPTALKLVGKRPGHYSSKLNVPLDPQMPAGQALKAILSQLLQTMEVNESGLLEDIDSEFLHDFRVAVRRTRSALGQVKGTLPQGVLEKFQTEFAWLGAATGPTRDLDVYLLKFDDYKASLPATMRTELDPLHEYLHTHKKSEHGALAEILESHRYRTLTKEWRAFLNSPVLEDASAPNAVRPVLEVANERIWQAYHRVMKKGAKIKPDSPAEDVHRLRIACKKLRYLLEFFQTLYPQSKNRALIKALKGIQDNLGDFNDLAVQMASLRKFGQQMMDEGTVPVETLMSMGVLVEHLQERLHRVRKEFSERFASFSKHENKALFQELFQHAANREHRIDNFAL